MASELFNSLSGYSVGIPPKQIVDSSGNVVTNLNAPTANVSANTFYANSYRFANGAPLTLQAGGSTTQLQFNNSGTLDGIPNVIWNGNTLSLGNVSAVNIGGGINGYFLQTDGEGGLTWAPANGGGGGGNGTPGGSNSQVQFNDAGDFGGDAGFTYDKVTNTLSAEYLAGDGSNITNITTLGTLTGLSVAGNSNFASTVNLGSATNVKIFGGLNGFVLTTDGTGNLNWQAGGGGGNGSPGGGNTQVQFNNSGVFGGSAFFTFDNITNTVQVGSKLIANSMQVGSGSYKFGSMSVMFAVSSSTAKQVIYSIPVTECSGVDFEIIGTDTVGLKRQSVKISSIYYAGNVQYNEYAGLYVNGGVGTFGVEFNPGTVLNPPSLDLTVTPDTTNNTVYKMLITVLAP
jgi:hypothetical protein